MGADDPYVQLYEEDACAGVADFAPLPTDCESVTGRRVRYAAGTAGKLRE